MSEPIRLWSVTSIEKQALGMGPGLVKHKQKTTAGIAYDRIKMLNQFVEDGDRDGAVDWLLAQEWAGLNRASARGTDLHTAAEALALGKEPTIEEQHRPYLDQFLAFLNDFAPEYVMSEAPVYHLAAGYAGTCDGIVVIDGQRLLFDIKTTQWSKASGKSRPPFHEHILQIAAYRHAELVGLLGERVETHRGRYYTFRPEAHTEPMPETDGAACLVISPHDYELLPVRSDAEVFRFFRHVTEIARWTLEVAPAAVGPAITPKEREVAA